eukprot:4732510-Pyramimonas_sp.AAC.1
MHVLPIAATRCCSAFQESDELRERGVCCEVCDLAFDKCVYLGTHGVNVRRDHSIQRIAHNLETLQAIQPALGAL